MTLLRNFRRAGDVRFGPEDFKPRPTHATPSDDTASAARQLRVMIVEDELFVAMHLESVLEDIGYAAAGIFSTGESAVRECRVERPDIVLMDINLGVGIDGIAAAVQIRAVEATPIIFVSAYSDTATRARIEAAVPGSRLLSKPVTPGGLKEAIESQAQKRQ